VTFFTGNIWGVDDEHAGDGALMAAPSVDPRSRAAMSPWMRSTCNRSYVMAALRATAIALFLLTLLVLMVLF